MGVELAQCQNFDEVYFTDVKCNCIVYMVHFVGNLPGLGKG